MSGSGKSAEASMDEILASIKQIISKDPEAADARPDAVDAVGVQDIDNSLDRLFKALPTAGEWTNGTKTLTGLDVAAEPPPGFSLPARSWPGAGAAGHGGDARFAGAAGVQPRHAPAGAFEPSLSIDPRGSVPVDDGAATAPVAAAPERALSERVTGGSALEAIRVRARKAAGLLQGGREGGGPAPDSVSVGAEAARAAISAPREADVMSVTADHLPYAHQNGTDVPSLADLETGQSRPTPNGVSGEVAGTSGSEAQELAASVVLSAAQVGGDVAQPAAASGRSLEDTVAELLRPMLKKWLDENLPRIVEHVLREELLKPQASNGKTPG